MDDLHYQLKQLGYANREGSHSTQANRRAVLQLCAKELSRELGYRKLQAKGLKPKHVEALVKHWKQGGLENGTIKNRMAHLRWWANKVSKEGMVKKNEEYGIGNRVYVTNETKAQALDRPKLDQISNERVVYSLRLQEQFGLRREESIKFKVSYADRGDHIRLKSSWTKGGKERDVVIRKQAQRDLLNELKNKYGNASLIEDQKTYKQQLKLYEWHLSHAGLHKMHGLRHGYAQTRYQELTDTLPPALGGKSSKDMTAQEKALDDKSRLIISRELGHERKTISSVYLGR